MFCDVKERCYVYVITRDEIMLISLEYVHHREPNFRIISKVCKGSDSWWKWLVTVVPSLISKRPNQNKAKKKKNHQ